MPIPVTQMRCRARRRNRASTCRSRSTTRLSPRSRRRFTTTSSCSSAGSTLPNEQHIAFSRRFGELEIHIVKKYLLPGYPEILLVSNIKNEAGEHIGLADAGFTWHSDISYRRYPSRCSLLYAKEVPHARRRRRSATRCSPIAIAAYEALPRR